MKKSKGYAIEFLIESLTRSGELESLDALVMIDADTTIDRGLLRCFDEGLRAATTGSSATTRSPTPTNRGGHGS